VKKASMAVWTVDAVPKVVQETRISITARYFTDNDYIHYTSMIDLPTNLKQKFA
jgi:hypothetical protein